MSGKTFKAAALAMSCLMNVALFFILLMRNPQSQLDRNKLRPTDQANQSMRLAADRPPFDSAQQARNSGSSVSIAISREGPCKIPAAIGGFYLLSGPVFDNQALRLSLPARKLLGLPDEALDQIDELLKDFADARGKNPLSKKAALSQLYEKLETIVTDPIAYRNLRSYLARL